MPDILVVIAILVLLILGSKAASHFRKWGPALGGVLVYAGGAMLLIGLFALL